MPKKPQKRKTKPKPKRKRAIKRSAKSMDVTAEAARIAELLSTAPQSSDYPIPPPMFLTGPLLAAAGRVWRDTASYLDQLNLLGSTDKYLLAAFCVYTAQFVAMNEQAQGREVVWVKTISGDSMPRTNPAVDLRDTAFKCMVELSKCFGFTPRHMHELTKLQKASDTLPLFTPQPVAEDSHGEAQVDPGAKEWGSLLDSPARPN